MRIWWNQSVIGLLACMCFCFSGCATMQNWGNSLAFWKKSPPKDQFAMNPKSPSATFSPSGVNSPGAAGAVANNGYNSPNSYPFNANSAQNNSFASSSNTQNAGSASSKLGQPSIGRAPYNGLPPSSGGVTNPNAWTAGQPAARTARSTPAGQFSSSNQNFGTRSAPQTQLNPSNSNAGFNATATPSNQFQSKSGGFQPSSSGGFVPGPSFATPNQPTRSSSTLGDASPNVIPSSKQPESPGLGGYPKTRYPSFGANGANKSLEQAGVKPASSNITLPPSLPSNAFEKTGSYAPGSTGTATTAGFESGEALYTPGDEPSGAKIPASSDGLYRPK